MAEFRRTRFRPSDGPVPVRYSLGRGVMLEVDSMRPFDAAELECLRERYVRGESAEALAEEMNATVVRVRFRGAAYEGGDDG